MKETIVFSEDFAIRLMIADGMNVDIYSKPVVYYEKGTGITSPGSGYGERFKQGQLESIKMLIDRYSNDKHLARVFKNRFSMIEHYSKWNHLCYLLSDYHIPQFWLRRKFFPVYTSTEWENDFLQQCYND